MKHRNHSTAIFLINDKVRAIATTYEEIDLGKDTTKMKFQPEYLSGGKLPKGAVVFKTMDPDIKVDDFVVVPTDTRHGLTVCKVVAVDIEIDFSSDKECHWVIETVDTTEFERLRQEEEKMILAIKSAETNQEREKLSEALIANLGNGVKQIPLLDKESPADNKGNGKE